MVNPENYKIIKRPLVTEATWELIESQNTIVFIVDRRATKPEIKAAIEDVMGAKVAKVNTQITRFGKKKAYVKFAEESMAAEIAIQLNIF